jgi:dipeptide/tripeptide permease
MKVVNNGTFNNVLDDENPFKGSIKQNDEIKSSSTNTKYPKHVFLIISNELCERFSFYGLRAILYIYLTNFIKLNKDSATSIYHMFTVGCYLAPILGATLSVILNLNLILKI